MSKQYISTALIALAAALSFSQSAATGLTYDPCENYYDNFYGMNDSVSVTTSSVHDNVDVLAPYDGYYTRYHSTDIDDATLAMEDPQNYYQW